MIECVSAKCLRRGDIVRPASFDDEKNPSNPCDPAWSNKFEFVGKEPAFKHHEYNSWELPSKEIFVVLDTIYPVWIAESGGYDVKFFAATSVGAVIVWVYRFELFEVISRIYP